METNTSLHTTICGLNSSEGSWRVLRGIRPEVVLGIHKHNDVVTDAGKILDICWIKAKCSRGCNEQLLVYVFLLSRGGHFCVCALMWCRSTARWLCLYVLQTI